LAPLSVDALAVPEIADQPTLELTLEPTLEPTLNHNPLGVAKV